MYDICCIGHITHDKVITTRSTVHMAGGTSFYFSNAIHQMNIKYHLVTSLAEADLGFVTSLRNHGIGITVLPSTHTVYFENTYPENPDHRTQRVLQKADPFTITQLSQLSAGIFHLGPLLADDMPVSMIQSLAERGAVSLDVQGYLREVRGEKVCPIDWPEKKQALQHITYLKANEYEMEVITGCKEVREAAVILSDWGVKEVIITLGSMGSVIYDGHNFYDIPAYIPDNITDVTGCGDTYMAGYLYQRTKSRSIQEAGEFAAAMATLKICASGPFTGTEADVMKLLAGCNKTLAPAK